jgi:hypothetical protein
MGLSGKWLAAIAAGLMLLACAGCGGASEVAGKRPAHAAELKTAPTTTAAATALATVGAPIGRSQAALTLPATDASGIRQPVAYAAGRVLLSISPADPASSAPQSFQLWDTASGAMTPAWTGEPGKQDIVTAASGDWVATVRTGFDLPFPDWQLIMRNVTTGETRVLATGDPSLAGETGLHPDLPVGLAPYPALDGDLVAWEEFTRAGGHVGKSVKVANLATGETRAVASIADARAEDLRLPAIGGARVAWVHRTFGAAPTATIAWSDLGTGQSGSIADAGDPWAVALTAGGDQIAWDDGLQAKVALDLNTGVRTRYAGAVGWGVMGNGRQLSWSPAGAQGGAAGFFDTATGAVRMVRPSDGTRVNVAGLFGPWFTWQELTPTTGAATYYFIRAAASAS